MNWNLVKTLKQMGLLTVSALALSAGVTGCATKKTILGQPEVPPPVTTPDPEDRGATAPATNTNRVSNDDFPWNSYAEDDGEEQQDMEIISMGEMAPPPPAQTDVPDVVVAPANNTREPIDMGGDDSTAPTPVVREPTQIVEPKPLPVANVEPLTYTVKKGDNLWKIGRMYGVSMQELASYNNRNLNDMLQVGTALKLPPGARFVPENERPPVKKKESQTRRPAPAAERKPSTEKYAAEKPVPADGKYTVQRGDTLSEIAQMFGLSVKGIMDMNDLKDSKIFPRQTLIVGTAGSNTAAGTREPVRSAAPPPRVDEAEIEIPAPELGDNVVPAINITEVPEDVAEAPAGGEPSMKVFPHWCDEGETIESIAKMYDSEVAWILKANPGLKKDDTLTGKKIDVPVVENN